ncbi:hypothetical protein K2173_023410 [Erythroxylum novogranatense]|uniref:HMG box domain-containing protein n=1 Tax=Erythroxylum novogranatense TaxID=1862640 RepID=A0AAV8TVV3_9ROSI|nr:hypothetical protein K2173_023410 [Erythroxylum novogranatense]
MATMSIAMMLLFIFFPCLDNLPTTGLPHVKGEFKAAMKGGKAKADTSKTDARLKKKGAGTRKATKKVKDPNKPKRPPSAFFVFMEEFRQQYKEKHPTNKSVAAVGKAGGDKWKSMSDAEKAPFVAKAEKRKAEYTKDIAAYNKRLAGGGNDDESDKSKSEVNDEENEDEESGEDEEGDD